LVIEFRLFGPRFVDNLVTRSISSSLEATTQPDLLARKSRALPFLIHESITSRSRTSRSEKLGVFRARSVDSSAEGSHGSPFCPDEKHHARASE